MIYDFLKNKSIDSLKINLKKDLTDTKGDVKLTENPIILRDSILIFALNDGSINCYDFFNKNYKWKYNNEILISYHPILTSNNLVHIVTPSSGLKQEQINVTTLNIDNGKLTWKASFSNVGLNLYNCNNKLQTVNTNGELMVINPENGHLHKKVIVNFNPGICYFLSDRYVAIGGKTSDLYILNIENSEIIDNFKFSSSLKQISFSPNQNLLIVRDNNSHIFTINVVTKIIRCISDEVDDSDFLVDGDNLYFNKSYSLQLLKLIN